MARRLITLLFAVSVCALSCAAAPGEDETAVRLANDDYVRAFQDSNLARFQGLLAPDFTAVLADGRLINRSEFLRQAAVKPDAQHLKLKVDTVWVHDGVAALTAMVEYDKSDNSSVHTRYTALFFKEADGWKIQSVQWTRVWPR